MSTHCAKLSLRVEPETASVGETVEILGTVTNCASINESLTVELHITGPGYTKTYSAPLTLGPGEKQSEKRPFTAPAAPGLYTLTAIVRLEETELDAAQATLTVE
ncbi:MAG TPA: hypothetical protein VJT09_05900 [Pyrinomonadaceae bacterium]|nr:hypothetical protein [Pyrinomonadaceae bacterium]